LLMARRRQGSFRLSYRQAALLAWDSAGWLRTALGCGVLHGGDRLDALTKALTKLVRGYPGSSSAHHKDIRSIPRVGHTLGTRTELSQGHDNHRSNQAPFH